jgi:hypothetical protein
VKKLNHKKRSSNAGGSGMAPALSSSFDPLECLALYSGQELLGHLLHHGGHGVEAFDRDDRSLGIFSDQKSAAAAISAKAVSS